jgi:RimJ/RimL family protein N-acetyltransferase
MSRIEPKVFQCRTSDDVIIRTAEIRDATRLLEIAHDVMAEREVTLTEWDEAKLTINDEEQWIQAASDHSADIILVAEIRGEVVGILNLNAGAKRKIAHTGEFGMSVVKLWRDFGIGRALLTALIDWALKHPTLEKLDLAVFGTNSRAIHLYDSLGFREEGRRKNAIKLAEGRYDDLVLMAKSVSDMQL